MIRRLILPFAMAGAALSAHADAGYTYWFDGDSTVSATAGGVLSGNGAFSLDIDASALDGSRPHSVHFQVADADGRRSAPRSAMFLKPFTLAGSTAHIYVDGLYHSYIATTPTESDAAIMCEIDASAYGYGLHTIMAHVVTHDNIPAAPVEGLFMRVPTEAEVSGYRCFFTLDNDSTMLRAGTYSAGIVHADIDVESLSIGLHSIQFMLASPDGLTTQCKSAFFMKLPLGGGDISSYDYWVNDDTDHITHVDLKEAMSPFRLTGLLPVKSYPLRTSSFRFRVEGGKPVIYPLNDFNLLVSSANGLFTTISSPFFDASMPTSVKAASIVPTPEGTVTAVSSIGENEIRWYEFDVKRGDSIAVTVDKPCTVELFDNESNIRYSASGHDAVVGGGFHAFSDGKVYMAVHDAKKTGAINATVKHIDRYAVLKHTPDRMAPDGLVFIDLTGNGFDHLKKVTLGDNDIIECDSLFAYDHAFARAQFNFYGKKLSARGPQKLTCYFDDGTPEGRTTVTLDNAITFEDVQKGEISVRVLNSASVGGRHYMTVAIKNSGSISRWGIPINIAFGNIVHQFEFDNFHVITPNPLNGVEFPISHPTDNLLETGKPGIFMPMILPYIAPYETLQLKMSVTRFTLFSFDMYAWVGEAWSDAGRYLLGETGGIVTPPQQPDCINYDTFADMQSLISEHGGTAGQVANVYLGLGQTIGGIYLGLGKRQRAEERRCYGADYAMVAEYLPQYDSPLAMSPQAIFQNSMPLPEWLSLPASYLFATNEREAAHAECANPRPTPTRINLPVSHDPNDILGYRSPADTEHIGRDVKTLEYTLEFENDPELATASAVTIVVTNTLDKGVFDLATFKAGEFTIGKHTIDFEGAKKGVRTIDIRPEINGIAQVSVDFNESSGELLLTVNSLDPITLELTDDVMQGVLPVNNDGNGTGQLTYSIDLREGLADNTTVGNKATIVFDENPPIDTPTWHNITDYTLPHSEVTDVATDDDGMTFAITVSSSDTGSGIWHYDLYARWDGQPDWTLMAESLEADESGMIAYSAPAALPSVQFATVAYDRAGNREDSALLRKLLGDVDGSGKVDANDVLLLRAYYIERPVTLDLSVADVNSDGRVDAQDATAARVIYLDSQVRPVLRTPHVRTRKHTSR
ncbi:dockerin type I repeat-containing protein [uncultured Muribaculum sp.]|uniref:dockerin type I repeat-containing protein n=1 Tax=uncultured Muribaculum sp. TaxID=1918613 RepID=UPI0025DAE786|nr:dockerin type I repeat-containing protein [uncultured Muribaculum sp.]